MAVGVIHRVTELGRSVPQDLSVVGFDDVPDSAHSLPPLTTVDVDFTRIGEHAVETVLSRLEGREPAGWDAAAFHLVVRQSTAPPRR